MVTLEASLDQQFDLSLHPNGVFENLYRGGEKWLYSFSSNKWYFILPNEELYEWDETPFALSGTLIAQLNPGAHTNPALLYDPSSTPVQATAILSGNVLTLTKIAGFSGTVVVTVTVDDGNEGQDSETFKASFLPSPRPSTRSAGGIDGYHLALDAVLSKDDLLEDVTLDELLGGRLEDELSQH